MFYDRLKFICSEKGVKLTPLIKQLGMSQGNLSRWKNGGSPTIEVINALSERLDISVDYLLEKTDDPTPANKKKAPPEDTDEAIWSYARERLGHDPTPEDLAIIHSAVDIAIQHLENQRK